MVTEMEHKYKTGEKVYVSYCTDDIRVMQDYVGTFMTVDQQTSGLWGTDEYEWPAYRMKEDEGLWYWREDWLSPAENIDENRDIDISSTEIFNIFRE